MTQENAPLVITRPQPDADRWVERLGALGCVAAALPLIDIRPVAHSEKLQVLVDGVARYDAVMWVSGNAVTRFFARRHGPWPADTRCWAPGPGTAQVLRAAGVPADRIDAPLVDAGQFDSEALWSVISSQVRNGVRLLLVRGRSQGDTEPQGTGRDWLLQRCRASGAQVDIAVVYERACPDWSDAQRAQARQWWQAGSPWLFSSSEAVAHLASLLPDADWSTLRALATHERIAEALQARGVRLLKVCRPMPEDVCQALAP